MFHFFLFFRLQLISRLLSIPQNRSNQPLVDHLHVFKNQFLNTSLTTRVDLAYVGEFSFIVNNTTQSFLLILISVCFGIFGVVISISHQRRILSFSCKPCGSRSYNVLILHYNINDEGWKLCLMWPSSALNESLADTSLNSIETSFFLFKIMKFLLKKTK